MKHFCCFLPQRGQLALALKWKQSLCAVGLFFICWPCFAALEDITRELWKLKFHVTDAQISSADWLAADDDKDGISNGAEMIAGTDPFNGTSTVKVSAMTVDATSVNLSFPTVANKQYFIQSTTTLGQPNSWLPQGSSITAVPSSLWLKGDGTTKSLSATRADGTYYRVVVKDLDSDGDGASDWAEAIAGYKSDSATTNGTTPDGPALAAAIAAIQQPSTITVSVIKPSATQPLAGLAPVETGSIRVTRTGLLKLGTLGVPNITVPLVKSGSAIEGVDYDGIAATAAFTTGISEVVVPINPRANSSRRTNVSAILRALDSSQPGAVGTYTLGASTSGSVVINPAGVADGTGLTGGYYKTYSTTYGTGTGQQLAIFAGAPTKTRIDPTIDFQNNTNSNGWGTTTGPTGFPTTSDLLGSSTYSIRWTGQVMPQYSEIYTFDIRSDDSAKLWVNGVLLVDRWIAQGATDYLNSITLKAGVLYDIQIDYFNSGGSAEARLYWWSPSQTKQIIPSNRLFPAPGQAGKVTPITSSLTAVGYENVQFNLTVTSPDISTASVTTYALAADSGPLPPGLTLTNGEIAGKPTLAGTYNVAINATNSAAGTVTGSSVINFTIYPTGGVSRELFSATGSKVSDIVIPANATELNRLAAIDDSDPYASNTGERLRGYLIPPKTGNYYFWIAANNAAELWISNDAEYVNKVRRASIVGGSGKKAWNASATQQSPWLSLIGGQKYYFEVLHNTGSDTNDHVAVGWCQDDLGTVPAVPGAPNAEGTRTLIPNGGTVLQGYSLSGTIPGYYCQPYDYPVVTPSTGKLYAGNLGPQGVATTTASGSVNLEVNAAETQAILRFKFQNLSSPRTAYHLHVDGFTDSGGTVHPQGEIIFDIDDADGFPAELRTSDGGYVWNLGTVGSFTSVAQIREAIRNSKVYLNIHSVGYPAGEIRGTLSLINGSQTPPLAASYLEPATTDDQTKPEDAARFLNQASFGASPSDVAYVQANGFRAWINDQLGKSVSSTANEVVANATADVNQVDASYLFTNAWWKHAITGEDQLRQRLAFALSEIMVVSYANDTGPLATKGRILADYYDNLLDYCLPKSGLPDSGNFRGILKAVTLTPAMGLYLDMRGNQKGDDSVGRHPNENYAREIMQLFSVGVYRMWDDGRFVLGSDAGLVPTYSQPNIIGLAALLTGWNYAQPGLANGRAPTSFSPATDYLNPMVLVPSQHDFGPKNLLDNVVSPPASGLIPRVGIASIAVGTPGTIGTVTRHGLKVGDTVTISGVSGGSFSTAINATHVVTSIVDPVTFRVGIDCLGVPSVTGAMVAGPSIIAAYFPRTNISSVSVGATGAGTVVNTSSAHGLKVGDPVTISGVTGGTFTASINGIFTVSAVVSSTAFRIANIDCSVAPTASTGTVSNHVASGGGFTTAGITPVAGSQSDSVGPGPNHPYDLFGLNELNLAIDNIVNNDNVAPYICRQLIQRFVTSAPSPGYVYRVVQKFKDNGAGVRGDLAAVITQVLLDGEARRSADAQVSTTFGKQREPVMRLTGPARAFPAANYTGTYTQLTGIDSNKLRIVTSMPNDFSSSFSVSLDFSGNYSSTTPPVPFTNPSSTTYTVSTTLGIVNTSTVITSIATGNPAVVACAQPHGLNSGDTVTISGITDGSYKSLLGSALTSINTSFVITKIDATSFSIPVNCTLSPANLASAKFVSNPCKVTTLQAHGLATGNNVTITNVSGGTFTSTINNTYAVTIVDPTSFTIPIGCTAPATVNTGNIVGANTMDVPATGMVNVTYSQPANSSTMTVNTAGPTTSVAVPGTTSTVIPSRVYLKFLTQTSQGGAALPADKIYDVQSNGTNLFTVTTTDTPATARGGNVIIPKIATSYIPQTSNTVVLFNTNVNHNLSAGNHFWADVPVITGPLTDAEYSVVTIVDEDHLTTSYLPDNVNGGVYPKPTSSTNNVTIWPLVLPPFGRTGNVTVNQSTFDLRSTDASLTQSPLNAPTVFNFFAPDYKFPGTLANNGLDSPEFQLTTDTNVMTLTNSLTNMFLSTSGGNGNLNGLSSFKDGAGGVVLNIGTSNIMTPTKTANSGAAALVDQLSDLLVGAKLDPLTKGAIVNFVTYERAITRIDPGTPGVLTAVGHGLTTGDTVGIIGVSGGSFSTSVNANFTVVVTGPDTFTLKTIATTPVAVTCNNITGLTLSAAKVAYFPLSPSPTNLQMRDRVRAIVHLIVTSAEYAVQK